MLLNVTLSECSAGQHNLHKGEPYKDKQKLRNNTVLVVGSHEENICIKQFALRETSFLIALMSSLSDRS